MELGRKASLKERILQDMHDYANDDFSKEFEFFRRVEKYGPELQIVPSLIHPDDITEFFIMYKEEINDILTGINIYNLNGFDQSDKLILNDNNRFLVSCAAYKIKAIIVKEQMLSNKTGSF